MLLKLYQYVGNRQDQIIRNMDKNYKNKFSYKKSRAYFCKPGIGKTTLAKLLLMNMETHL